MSNAAQRLLAHPEDETDNREDEKQEHEIKGASKGAAVTIMTALLSKKIVRRKAVRQLMKSKAIRKNARKIVHALIKDDLVSKKDVKRFAGKKIAKKLVA